MDPSRKHSSSLPLEGNKYQYISMRLCICVVDKFTLRENVKTFQMEMLISNPMQLYGLLI